MNIVIEPSFAERSVFAAVRGGPLERDYARAFAACHEGGDRSSCDEAFRALHEEWFERLGFRGRLLKFIEEFPTVAAGVQQFALHEARQRSSAGMELYGATGRHAVLATMPIRLWLVDDDLAYWARFELAHIADLLDPAFAHDPALRPRGSTFAADNLARDRYAVLWACSIDARLEQTHGARPGLRQRRDAEFARAFGVAHPDQVASMVGELWSSWALERPDHPTLVVWASQGIPKFEMGSSAADTRAAGAGDPCPRCGFATYDWASAEDMCRRCAELPRAEAAVPAAQEVV